MDFAERTIWIKNEVSAWSERSEMARDLGRKELEMAAATFKSMCQQFSELPQEGQNLVTLEKASRLRKEIESGEQHRTMCAEHGLSNAAIDATYEIQELEKQLVALLAELKNQ